MNLSVYYLFHNPYPDASEVFLIGDFLKQGERIKLNKPMLIQLECAKYGQIIYNYKYIVDGVTKHSDKKLTRLNDKGEICNYIYVDTYNINMDLQQANAKLNDIDAIVYIGHCAYTDYSFTMHSSPPSMHMPPMVTMPLMPAAASVHSISMLPSDIMEVYNKHKYDGVFR